MVSLGFMPKSHKNSWTVSNEGAESTDDDLDDDIANQEAVEILDTGEPSNKKRRSCWTETNIVKSTVYLCNHHISLIFIRHYEKNIWKQKYTYYLFRINQVCTLKNFSI